MSGRVHRSRLRCRFGVAPHCRRRVRAESDEVVGAVVQHATAPSESEMRDEAMGAVAQRATVPRECESEIEQMGFCPLGIPTRLEPLLGFVQAAMG